MGADVNMRHATGCLVVENSTEEEKEWSKVRLEEFLSCTTDSSRDNACYSLSVLN